MTTIYNFSYINNDGSPEEFELPVNVTEDTDANIMHDICLSYLKINNILGTPVNAISTQKKYPNYCFSTTECTGRCNTCEDKRLPKHHGTKLQLSSESEWVYLYIGQYAKLGELGIRSLVKPYYCPNYVLMTNELMQDFEKEMNKQRDGMGWQLIGVSFYKKIPVEQAQTMFPKEQHEPDKMIWARVNNDMLSETAWIPALVRGGKIISAKGELYEPESSEDTRDFEDCPIPGYRIIKADEPVMKVEFKGDHMTLESI